MFTKDTAKALRKISKRLCSLANRLGDEALLDDSDALLSVINEASVAECACPDCNDDPSPMCPSCERFQCTSRASKCGR